MSEEEIISKLNLWMECACINNGLSCIVNIAELQGLLDLYNKEKETSHYLQSELVNANAKIIELENADLTSVYLDGVYDGEKKWKEKIKEKIKQYEGLKEMDMSAYEETINPLQDLLEEDNK